MRLQNQTQHRLVPLACCNVSYDPTLAPSSSSRVTHESADHTSQGGLHHAYTLQRCRQLLHHQVQVSLYGAVALCQISNLLVVLYLLLGLELLHHTACQCGYDITSHHKSIHSDHMWPSVCRVLSCQGQSVAYQFGLHQLVIPPLADIQVPELGHLLHQQ